MTKRPHPNIPNSKKQTSERVLDVYTHDGYMGLVYLPIHERLIVQWFFMQENIKVVTLILWVLGGSPQDL